MYFDTSYIAKFYLNEQESPQVRELAFRAGTRYSSIWALAEFHAVLHRQVREGRLSSSEAIDVASSFSEDIGSGMWELLPVSETLLRRTGSELLSAPPELFLRAGDAIHLLTAREAGEREVWTRDRHLLAAAPYFGLKGRSVTASTRKRPS